MTQQDLFNGPAAVDHEGVTEAELSEFRAALFTGTWLTRQQLTERLGWPDRKVRQVAEALGSEVVRCQLGFKLTECCTRDDVPAALQACDAFESQARKMTVYSTSLRRKLHALVG